MNIDQFKKILQQSTLHRSDTGRGSFTISAEVLGTDSDVEVTFDRQWKNNPTWKDGGVWWDRDLLHVNAPHQEIRLMVMGITGGVEENHYFKPLLVN